MRKVFEIRNDIISVENLATNLRASGNDDAADKAEFTLDLLYDELRSVEA